MALLLALPDEILHNVLRVVDPVDLAPLSLCCRRLQGFIHHNELLFKELYLQRLDKPPQHGDNAEPEWEKDVHALVKLQKIIASDQIEKKRSHLSFVTRTVSHFLSATAPDLSPSLSVTLLSRLFEDKTNQEAFLCSSTLFERARGPHDASVTKADRLLSAKLHSFYGVPVQSFGRTRSSRAYPYACSKVYDLRNYTDGTMWGPFLDDGSQNVDWEMVEAIMIILGNNLRMFRESSNGLWQAIWSKPFDGAYPNSHAAYSATRNDKPTNALDAQDPYGVAGTYMRVVCFLDYSELFSYNFASDDPPEGEPRPPLDTTEAIRVIIMELHVTKIAPPDEDDGQALPVVYFRGTSRALNNAWDPNATSNIRGTVRLTREGEIRWTTFSVINGEERWRSEGVQVGGIRSGRGVLGNWFDKDYDMYGPAGPNAFWKISNKIGVEMESDDEENEEEEEEDDEEMWTANLD